LKKVENKSEESEGIDWGFGKIFILLYMTRTWLPNRFTE
jgi:hypothetical protein